MMAALLRLTQVRSLNGCTERQRETLRTLGLGRIGKTVERPDGPALRGAVRRVEHLLKVE
jgi:large subunit ribosomal protein L30